MTNQPQSTLFFTNADKHTARKQMTDGRPRPRKFLADIFLFNVSYHLKDLRTTNKLNFTIFTKYTHKSKHQ